MHGDRERIHALNLELEAQDRPDRAENTDREEADPAADQTGTSPTSSLSDSEQAQANLERMLENGEENPIS